jgi:hypothetical protein
METNEYGVVVCPHCRFAKGIRLRQKTTRCVKCGKVWEIQKLRIIYVESYIRKLQEAVAAMNMKIGKNPKGYL